MGFVGNYAPCGLSPQTDGMPVILEKMRNTGMFLIFIIYFIYYFLILLSFGFSLPRFHEQTHCIGNLRLAHICIPQKDHRSGTVLLFLSYIIS